MAPIIYKFNGYRHRSRVAAFDFDWTLVKPKEGRQFPKNAEDWEWLRPNVPEIVRGYYEKGFGIVIFTNQTKEWKITMIKAVMHELNIPAMVAIAMEKDEHKPNTVMWDYAIKDKDVKAKVSFFVGDAMGRKVDWADTDLLFAQNVGLHPKTPEEIFPVEFKPVDEMVAKVAEPKVESNKKQKTVHKDEVKAVHVEHDKELIVMVGYPGSGKSHFAAELMAKYPGKYIVVSKDALKKDDKIYQAAKDALKNGLSPIIDATHPGTESRHALIQIAEFHKVKARCIWVSTSMTDSMARNNHRDDNDKPAVPKMAFYKYRKNFVEPSKDEGFEEVVVIS